MHAMFLKESINNVFIYFHDNTGIDLYKNFAFENDKWFFFAVSFDYETLFTSEIYSLIFCKEFYYLQFLDKEVVNILI